MIHHVINSLQHHFGSSIVASDIIRTKGLPTATTSDCDLVITVLNTKRLQTFFNASNGLPDGSRLSTVLINRSEYSYPIMDITIYCITNCYKYTNLAFDSWNEHLLLAHNHCLYLYESFYELNSPIN